MRRHVFVSHASAEQAAAHGLCDAIEAAGLACWIAPRDIPPGADWAEQIIDGIDAAWALVLVLGAAANRSAQVRREIERAVHKDVPVLAVRIEDVPLSKSLEYFLSAHHWIDAFGGPDVAQRARLVQALRALSESAAPSSATPESDHAPPPAPTPAPAPAWSAAALAPFIERLALVVGPVAAVLVARAARAARSEAELVERLAHEIDDPHARAAFVAANRPR